MPGTGARLPTYTKEEIINLYNTGQLDTENLYKGKYYTLKSTGQIVLTRDHRKVGYGDLVSWGLNIKPPAPLVDPITGGEVIHYTPEQVGDLWFKWFTDELGDLDIVKYNQRIIEPTLWRQMGYHVQFDEAGKIIGEPRKMTDEEIYTQMSPQEKMDYDINKKIGQHYLDALEGKLEVPLSITDELDKQWTQLSEVMSRQLGPNWQTTTPGIQAESEFNKRKALIIDQARRGEIAQSSGLLTESEGRIAGKEIRKTESLLRPGQIAMPGLVAGQGLLGTGSQFYGVGMGYKYNMQQLAMQEKLARMGYAAQEQSSIMDFLGTMAMALPGLAAMSCWVAEELWGKNNLRTYYARKYTITISNWWTRLYRKYGEKWAMFLHKYPIFKPLVKPIWLWMARQGRRL